LISPREGGGGKGGTKWQGVTEKLRVGISELSVVSYRERGVRSNQPQTKGEMNRVSLGPKSPFKKKGGTWVFSIVICPGGGRDAGKSIEGSKRGGTNLFSNGNGMTATWVWKPVRSAGRNQSGPLAPKTSFSSGRGESAAQGNKHSKREWGKVDLRGKERV